jgi:hypothetical protein
MATSLTRGRDYLNAFYYFRTMCFWAPWPGTGEGQANDPPEVQVVGERAPQAYTAVAVAFFRAFFRGLLSHSFAEGCGIWSCCGTSSGLTRSIGRILTLTNVRDALPALSALSACCLPAACKPTARSACIDLLQAPSLYTALYTPHPPVMSSPPHAGVDRP